MLTLQQSETALGCEVTIVLVGSATASTFNEYFRNLWLTVFEFEAMCSRFLPASELSALNRQAGVRQPVSREFREVLVSARKMAELSGGLYNPFILPALQRTGYVNSMLSDYQDNQSDDYTHRSITTIDNLIIDEEWASIPYGTAIDLGGCGKGFIGKKMAELADTYAGLQGYWISLGGDIVTCGLDSTNKPWEVYIESMTDRDRVIGKITMPDDGKYAVATSTPVRSSLEPGKSYRHIIDPKTGQPAETDINLATIFDDDAIKADVLASCALILGTAEAPAYLNNMDIKGSLLQTADGNIIVTGIHEETSSRVIKKHNKVKS
jgi:FAD:protein FMN transferase